MGQMKQMDIYLQEIESLKAHISELNMVIEDLRIGLAEKEVELLEAKLNGGT